MFINFYSIKIILKFYDERHYYILTIYFYNEKKVLYKESYFQKTFWNINVENTRFLLKISTFYIRFRLDHRLKTHVSTKLGLEKFCQVSNRSRTVTTDA